MDNQGQIISQHISPQPPEQQQNAPSNTSWLRILSIGFSIVSFCIAIGIGGYVLGARKSQQNQITNTSNNPIAKYTVQVNPKINKDKSAVIILAPQNAGGTITVSVGDHIEVKFPKSTNSTGYMSARSIPGFGEPGGNVIVLTGGASPWPQFVATNEGTATILVDQ